MRKKLSLLLFALAAMAVHAQSFLSGGIRYEVTGDNTVKVVTFNGGTNINGNAANYTGAISIPAKVTSEENVTYNVTEIGYQAFRAAQITAITIPASVTYVNDYAFYDCNNLSKVTISDGTVPITFKNYNSRTFSHGSYSVYMGRNVERENYNNSPFPQATAVTIGNKVTEVGDGMFNGCTKVASLKIGTGVTSIGASAFSNVGSEAGSLVFTAGPNVTSFGNACFAYSKISGAFVIPEGTETVPREMFRASSLTEITIPASVTYVNDYAFYDCNNLSKVTISDGTDPITFNNYSNRTFSHGSYTVYMGRNVEREYYNYSPFPQATAVTIGNQVTDVGEGMFNGCTKVASLIIGTGVTSIGASAFSNVGIEAETFEFTPGPNVTSFGNYCFSYMNKIGTFVIPQGTETIPYQMFRSSSLTEITIPASVTYVNDDAFYDCNNLSKVTISDGTVPITFKNYSSRPFSHGSYTVYMGRNVERENYVNSPFPQATAVTIGNQVTDVGEGMFNGCTKVASLKIGTGVTSIGASAFSNVGIEAETFEFTPGPNVTSFGNYCFSYMNKIGAFVIPQGTQTIPYQMFRSSSLTEITIPASVTYVDDDAFYDCNNLSKVTISDGTVPITFKNYSSRPFSHGSYTVYMGRNVERENYNYSPFPNITALTIGPKVSDVGECMFKGCAQLTTVSGAANVVTMGNEVYRNCTALTTVSLGNKLTVLPQSTFEACTALTSVNIPKTTTQIMQWAFYNCSSLPELTIPASVTNIGGDSGNRTFYGMSGMKRLIIADSTTPLTITENGYGTFFRDMTALDSLYMGRDIEKLQNNNKLFAGTIGTVRFSEKVTTLANNFKDVTAINIVWAPWSNPIAIDNDEFKTDVYSNGTLYVRHGRQSYYAAADGWKNFTHVDLLTFSVKITASTGGSATWGTKVASGNTVSGTQWRGGNVIITFAAQESYELSQVKVNNVDVTSQVADNKLTIQNIQAAQNVVVTFSRQKFTITQTAPTNGTIALSATQVEYGSSFTATFTPATGYELDKAYVNNVDMTSSVVDNVLTVNNVTENKNVTATFKLQTFTVTIIATGGVVTVSNMHPKYNERIVFTVVDDEDSELTSFKVNNVERISNLVNNTYAYTVKKDVKVVATFISNKEFITMSGTQMAYSSSNDLDFEGSDVKAYTVGGFDYASNTVLMLRVKDVPAGTGLVLKGTAGQTYKILKSEAHSYYVNLLKAQLTAGNVSATTGSNTNYTLREEGTGYFFFPVNGTVSLPANSAYLQIPTSYVTAGAKVNLVFDDEDDGIATGMNFVLPGNANDGHIYNLGGQRVNNPGKGVYIVNGRKVVIK